MSSVLPKYPNRMKECIQIAGYKIREVTAELNIPERTMRDYLTGRTAMPQDNQEALAALLGCSTEDFIPLSLYTSSFWNVPYQRNPYFTGREALLEQLYTSLHKNTAVAVTQTHALCGLGGIGKTQTVLEYAYRYRDEYQAVFWVKADARENLLSDFLSLATLLNLPERDARDQNVTLNAIKRWLQVQTAWLLIFDNADDLLLVRDFLPPGSRGHIVLSTRAQAMGRLAHRIDVEVMSREIGALFLLRRAGMIGPDTALEVVSGAVRDLALELVEELGGLPLALDQAGAYLEETQSSLAGYLQLYRNERLVLLSRRGGIIEDHPEPVATTWSLSFDEVERVNPTAADLLRFCTFLDPDAIPEELLYEGAATLGPVLTAVATDTQSLNQAIVALSKYSLIRRHADSQMLTLHRLVQVVLKERMDRETQHTWVERTVRAIHCAFPAHVEPGCWGRCQRLLPQVQNASLLIERWAHLSPEAAQVLNQAAYYLKERGLYVEAEALYRQTLAMREKIVGPVHLDTAQSAYNLARLYTDQGRYAEAEQLYLQVLAAREHLLGLEHSAVAQCLNSLALLYWFWGRYSEAESLYRRALPIYERFFGPEHPDTAHCLNNLALLHGTQGKYPNAEQLHRQVLAIRQKILPPQHPDTAQSLQNLACLFLLQNAVNHFAEAEQFLLQSLSIRERALGPEHPQTAKSLHNLALLYEAEGRFVEAEQLYQQVLTIRERVLGRENLKTLATIEDYASLLRKMQRENEAARLHARMKLAEASP